MNIDKEMNEIFERVNDSLDQNPEEATQLLIVTVLAGILNELKEIKEILKETK